MKKSTIVKWVALSTALTAVAAFAAGVAYDHVTTYSTGMEPSRRVIVAYDRDKR